MAYLKGVDLSGSSDISGSIGIFGQVTGSSFTGSFTGSFLGDVIGTISTASYVDYDNVANKPTLISSSTQIASEISGAFTADSASIATDIATLDSTTVKLTGDQSISGTKTFTGAVTASYLRVTNTASIGYLETIYETASIIYTSGSTKFGDTLDDTHVRTGSLLVTGSLYTINGEDIIITSALNAATSSLSSSLATGIASDSSSLASSITTNSSSAATDIAALVVDSGSFSTRVTDLETFSSSLDDTFVTEAELNTATASLSSSLATDIATKANSASFATDIASLVTDSGSFSTRVTANEDFSSSLSSTIISYTGSFSGDGSNLTGVVAAGTISSSAQIASDISGAFGAPSASFSTRVTDLETFSSSLDATFATEAELNAATASLSSSLATDIATNSASIADIESFPYTGSAYITGSLIVTGSIYSDSTIFATASHAISASYTTLAQTANTASYVETAQTASYIAGANVDGTVQNAVSASYAPGTGVSSIIAGQGISINQSTGDVTISTDTITGGSIASSSFADAVTTTLTHNFGSTNVIVATYDGSGNEIVPASITLDSANAVTATFASAQSGDLVVIEAQTGEFATASFSSTGSVTLNHSLGTQNLNVVAYDTSNVQFMPDIEVLDSSNVKATFAAPTSGKLLAVARNESVSASYSNTVDETITHNLSGSAIFVTVYDTSYNEILPDSVSVVDDNNINLTFAATSSGNVVIAGGVIDTTTISTATTYTQAISGSSSYTVNHNLNAEWPLVQVYDSASRAQFVPQSVVSVNANITNITFSTPFNGFVTINS